MKPFPSEGFPLPSSFCTPPWPCSAGAAAAIPAIPRLGKSAASFAANPRRVVRLENISILLLQVQLKKLVFLRQSKTENIASGRDGNVLFAVHRIAHRRSMHRLARVEMPQWLACFCVNCFERLGVVAKKNEARGRRHGSGGRPAAACRLQISPAKRGRIKIVGQKDLVTVLARRMARTGRVIGFSFLELLLAGKKNRAVFLRHK